MNVSFLRDARWLTPRVATFCARAIFALTVLDIVLRIAHSSHGIDRAGNTLGSDFRSFWAASEMALHGRAADVYVVARHKATEFAITAGRDQGYAAFVYPPMYLLVCLPLALLPYFVSVLVFQVVTGLAWLRVVQATMGWRAVVPVLAFPAALTNLGDGQNGFLTAALFGAGALALPRHKVLAGVCFGCLIIKPHLLLLVPVLLLLRRAWSTIAAGVVTSFGLIALSGAVFGVKTWVAFRHNMWLARAVLERGYVDTYKFQSVFQAVRVLHGGVIPAYAAQSIVGLGVCAALVVAQRRGATVTAMAMATACGTMLITPFLLYYDLMFLSLPLAWLLAQGWRGGFLPWEKLVMVVGFAMPLVSTQVTKHTHVSMAPVVTMAIFAAVIRRAIAGAGSAADGSAPDGFAPAPAPGLTATPRWLSHPALCR